MGDPECTCHSFEVCLQPLLFPYKVLALGKGQVLLGKGSRGLHLALLGEDLDLERRDVIQGLCAA